MATIALIVMQVLSILVMLLFVHEYKRITHKHERMLQAIDETAQPKSTLQSNVIIWTYVATIFSVTAITTALYVIYG